MRTLRKAFTLMEVNLAIVVMSTGILGLVALFALGFRENSQSIEDVEGTVCADRNMSALITALSSTNVTWSQWIQINQLPEGGWRRYFQNPDDRNATLRVVSNPKALANQAFQQAMSKVGGKGSFDDFNMQCGLVLIREGARISISMRASNRPGTLVYSPIYYTEVFFQGLKGQGEVK